MEHSYSTFAAAARRVVCAILRRLGADEAGTGTALSLYMLVGMLMFGGVAVDYANGLRAKSQMQAIADAVALSASMQIPDATRAVQVGRDVVARNRSANGAGAADIRNEDIVLGRWDRVNFRFVATTIDPDAVQVTARLSQQRGNALRTLLLRLVGRDTLDVTAVAIARRPRLSPCSGGGFFSRERTTVMNSNTWRSGFCLHGDLGVTLHNANTFEAGTQITMPNTANLVQHTHNTGVVAALREGTHGFHLLNSLPSMMAAMRSGLVTTAGLPSYITHGPILLNSITPGTNLVPGRLYVVNGSVNFNSNVTIENIAIVATGTIRVNSNTILRNVVLASDGEVTINSNNTLGLASHLFCQNGGYSTYVLTRNAIVMNSNNTMRGVMMLASGRIATGSNNIATDGIYAEAGGAIELGSSSSTAGCPDGLMRNVGARHLGDIWSSLVF